VAEALFEAPGTFTRATNPLSNDFALDWGGGVLATTLPVAILRWGLVAFFAEATASSAWLVIDSPRPDIRCRVAAGTVVPADTAAWLLFIELFF